MADEELVDASTLVDTEFREPVLVSCNRRDYILYSIGIGCSELRFTHEDADGFAAFPTYPVRRPRLQGRRSRRRHVPVAGDDA
eukprot:3051499-Prymnesium_polylepis.1